MMHKFPSSMSLGTGGLSSEVDNTHSLGSKQLIGKLLVLRRRRQGRAMGQASRWCEGDPPGGRALWKCCVSCFPVFGATGQKGARMERVEASLHAGKDETHPETWAVEALPQK